MERAQVNFEWDWKAGTGKGKSFYGNSFILFIRVRNLKIHLESFLSRSGNIGINALTYPENTPREVP